MQLALAGGGDLHFNFSKCVSLFQAPRDVTQRVLLAKVAGDFRGDAFNRFCLARKIGDSSRIFREAAEKFRVFFHAVRADKTDRIDLRLRLAGFCQDL